MPFSRQYGFWRSHLGQAVLGVYIIDVPGIAKMDMTDLGSFNLLEEKVDTAEGMRACQDYGRILAEKLMK